MDDSQFAQYVASTQGLVTQMNQNLEKFQEQVRLLGEAQKGHLHLAASAYDMSYLALRVLSELHVDFRTMLIRYAQEPAANPSAQENRERLLDALSSSHKASGDRPTLKPVPPSGRVP